MGFWTAIKAILLFSGLVKLWEKWMAWRRGYRQGQTDELLASRERELKDAIDQETVAADLRSALSDPRDRARWLREQADRARNE